MEWSDAGIVLARGVFREADVWLRVLFERHGALTVFAFGGARSRRRFVGCLDILNVLDCRVRRRPGGRYDELAEAVLLQGPGTLRSSRPNLGLAVNCLKLADGAVVPPEASPDAFRLLRETVGLLDSGDGAARFPAGLLVRLFRLKFMTVLGFAPNFLGCPCGAGSGEEGGFFCVEEGSVVCPSCRSRLPRRHSGAPLARETLAWLARAQASWPGDWPDLLSETPPPADLRGAGRCIDGMLRHHVGLAWDSGRYVRV